MEKIKVLIVDDSAFMRKLIHELLSESSLVEVIGTARNGLDAVNKVKELKPDVVTLDIEMPVLNGLEALRLIMKDHPVPVVMLSSTTQEGKENAILSMQFGAIDFIAKPSGNISLDLYKIKDELVQKVLLASKVNIQQLANNSSYGKSTIIPTGDYSKIRPKESLHNNPQSHSFKSAGNTLVCIGTSTGGPRALQQVITRLPANLDAPVFVVQHMPAGFTKSLANRLDSLSAIGVKEAEDGEVVKKGMVYIAPGGYHLKVRQNARNLTIELDGVTPPKNGHRPSVDVMFESISNVQDYSKISVIMTGMGADGSEGLIELKKKGEVKAIAESKESCIVFGMPKAAIATNLIDEIQDVDHIAETILKYV